MPVWGGGGLSLARIFYWRNWRFFFYALWGSFTVGGMFQGLQKRRNFESFMALSVDGKIYFRGNKHDSAPPEAPKASWPQSEPWPKESVKKEGCNGTVHNLITLNIPINLKRLLHCTVHIHDTTPCHSIEGRPFLGEGGGGLGEIRACPFLGKWRNLGTVP